MSPLTSGPYFNVANLVNSISGIISVASPFSHLFFQTEPNSFVSSIDTITSSIGAGVVVRSKEAKKVAKIRVSLNLTIYFLPGCTFANICRSQKNGATTPHHHHSIDFLPFSTRFYIFNRIRSDQAFFPIEFPHCKRKEIWTHVKHSLLKRASLVHLNFAGTSFIRVNTVGNSKIVLKP